MTSTGAAATSSGSIIAVGGESPAGTIGEVEAWDVAARRWFVLPEMPTPRHGLGVIARGSMVWALAGGPEPGYTFSPATEMLTVDEQEMGT